MTTENLKKRGLLVFTFMILVSILIASCKTENTLNNTCKNNKCINDMNTSLSENTTDNNSMNIARNFSVVKKIHINKQIMDDSRYCNSRQIVPSDCVCQEGYIRVEGPLVGGWGDRHVNCFPQICMYSTGITIVGDVDVLNRGICYLAILKKDYSSCGLIDDDIDRDFCSLAYVGLTGNKDICKMISENDLRRECNA